VQHASAFTEALAALNHPDATVVLTAGEHEIDNPLVASGRSGRLEFAPGASLRARNRDTGGVRFVQSFCLTLVGFRIDWTGTPTTRSHFGAGLMFVDCAETEVRDCGVTNAPGAGLHFDVCQRVRVDEVDIAGSSADGVHFANCTEVLAAGLRTRDTGDDGVACVDYRSKPAGSNLSLSRISVIRSRARGISVVGSSDVRISDFSVEQTASSGLLIVEDHHYRTRRPAEIVVTAGKVSGGGRFLPSVGNAFGVEVIGADGVELSELAVIDPQARAVSMVDVGGRVRVSGLSLQTSVPQVPAIEFRSCDQVSLTKLSITGAPTLALLVDQCRSLALDGLSVASPPSAHGDIEVRFSSISRASIKAVEFSGPASGVIRIAPEVSGSMTVRAAVPAVRIDNRSTRLRLIDETGGKRV
jgi:polygalacturonase